MNEKFQAMTERLERMTDNDGYIVEYNQTTHDERLQVMTKRLQMMTKTSNKTKRLQ